jgi:hypothetical protein
MLSNPRMNLSCRRQDRSLIADTSDRPGVRLLNRALGYPGSIHPCLPKIWPQLAWFSSRTSTARTPSAATNGMIYSQWRHLISCTPPSVSGRSLTSNKRHVTDVLTFLCPPGAAGLDTYSVATPLGGVGSGPIGPESLLAVGHGYAAGRVAFFSGRRLRAQLPQRARLTADRCPPGAADARAEI